MALIVQALLILASVLLLAVPATAHTPDGAGGGFVMALGGAA